MSGSARGARKSEDERRTDAVAGGDANETRTGGPSFCPRRRRRGPALSDRDATSRLYETWSDDAFVLSTARRLARIHTIPPKYSPTAVTTRARCRPPRCRCRDFVMLQPDAGVYVCPRHFRVHRCGEEWFRRCRRLPRLDPATIDCPRAQGGSSTSGDGADCCLHTGRVLDAVEFVKTENLSTTAEMHLAVYGCSLYFGGRDGQNGERGSGGGGGGGGRWWTGSRSRVRLAGPCATVSRRGARAPWKKCDPDAKFDKGERLLRATIRRVVELFSDDANREKYNEIVESRKKRRGADNTRGSTVTKGGRLARGGRVDGAVRLSVGRITPGIRSTLEAHVRTTCVRLLRRVPRRDKLPAESVAFCALTKAATGVRCGDRVVLPPLPFVGLLPLPSERDVEVAFGLSLKKYSRVCEAVHLALGDDEIESGDTRRAKRGRATNGRQESAAGDLPWPVERTTERLLDDMAVSLTAATAPQRSVPGSYRSCTFESKS